MKKIIIAVIAVSLLLLVSGCQEIKNFKLPKTLPGFGPAEDEFTAGSLSSLFVNPKEGGRVLSDYQFSPVVRVNNLGDSDADGQLCITGLDEDVFSGFAGCDCQSFLLEKNDAGKYEPEDVKFGAYTIRKSASERSDFQVSSVTRFEYRTDIKADICLSSDAYEPGKCSISTKSVSNGPVEVTGIEQETIPISDDIVTLIFTITVEKAAPGKLIPESALNRQCMPVPPEETAKIDARVLNFPLRVPVTCREAEVGEEETIITCEAKDINLVDSSGSSVFTEGYSPEVTFQLKYFFETTDSSKFTIA